jgi:hypothetical protein
MKTGLGVPIGSYSAEFVKAEPFEENVDRFGPAVLLVWRILDGKDAGEEATRICSAKLNAKTNLFKLACGLNGGPIEPGEEVDLESFYGTKGLVVVEETEGGHTRVATFLKN